MSYAPSDKGMRLSDNFISSNKITQSLKILSPLFNRLENDKIVKSLRSPGMEAFEDIPLSGSRRSRRDACIQQDT